MPRIPTYEGQLSPRGVTGATVESAVTYMPFVNAINQTGSMVEARGAQLLQEYDTTRAYTAFNDLRDQSRGKMEELMQREGIDAQGAQQEYSDYYKKAKESVTKSTINAYSQSQLFDRLSNSHQQGDLDQLARHEYTQHKAYTKTVVNGYIATVERDIRENVMDDDKMDGMIYGRTEQDGTITPGLWGAIDTLGSGLDRTAAKMAATQSAREAAADELINVDPKRAAIKLEEWRTELGDKYAPLKKRLAIQSKSDDVAQAMVMGEMRFGSNYEAAAHYFSQASKFGEWKGDPEKSRELENHFRGLANNRETDENRAHTQHERRLQDNDFKVLTALNDPDPTKPRPDMQTLAQRGEISQSLYKYWLDKKESKTADNPFVYNQLYERALRGEDVRGELPKANSRGLISDATVKEFGKMYVSERHKEAYKNVKDAIDPGQGDRAPDRALKFYDANKKLTVRIEAGEDPVKASDAVISEYTEGLKRTWGNLPLKTQHLQGDRKDRDAVDAAISMAASSLAAGRITFDQYKKEMDTLESMRKLTRETMFVDEALQTQRDKEARDAKKPGGNKY